MRKIFLGLAVLLSVAPLSALAQSSSASVQIAALTAQIAQLQAQIQALAGSSTAATSTPVQQGAVPPAQNAGTCPVLTRSLSLGASGADVANVQVFLAGQGLFSGSATGYYGPITASAVGKWQQSQGILAGGSATSTGFGIIGPKTRAAIAATCGSVAGGGGASPTPKVQQCIPAQPPQNLLCTTSWQPVTDKNGCTIYYQCVISLPSGGSSAATSTGPSCPFVQKPTCSGTISPFSTDQNGCVTAYVCSVQ